MTVKGTDWPIPARVMSKAEAQQLSHDVPPPPRQDGDLMVMEEDCNIPEEDDEE